MADTTISQLQSLVASGNTIVPVSLGGTTYQTPASSIVDTIGSRNNFIQLPTGTTEQRGTPAAGALRYNTSTALLEVYTGTVWKNVYADIANTGVISSITSGWSFPINQDETIAFNNSNYYGKWMGFANNNGTSKMNSGAYEYPIVSKYNLRTSSDQEILFQLYGFNATGTNFWQSVGNESFFQMGIIWDTDPTTLVQTNSLKATSPLPPNKGAYFVCRGARPENTTWSFYNGGGNNNSAAGNNGNNLETSSNVNWQSTQTITLVVKADTRIVNARKIGVFIGDNLIYVFNTTVPYGTNNIKLYVGNGYPSTSAQTWNNSQPMFRYQASASINVTGL